MASSLPSLRILIRLATMYSSRPSNQCSRGMQKAQCCLQTSWQTMQAKVQLDPPHAQGSAKRCERSHNVLPLSHHTWSVQKDKLLRLCSLPLPLCMEMNHGNLGQLHQRLLTDPKISAVINSCLLLEGKNQLKKEMWKCLSRPEVQR